MTLLGSFHANAWTRCCQLALHRLSAHCAQEGRRLLLRAGLAVGPSQEKSHQEVSPGFSLTWKTSRVLDQRICVLRFLGAWGQVDELLSGGLKPLGLLRQGHCGCFCC